MPRNSEYIPLSEALKMFIEAHKLQKGIDQIQVRDAWIRLMGKGVNKYTTAIRLRNHTLTISLSSSVLREELGYGKQKIIALLNEELGKDLIKTLLLQ